MAISGPNRIRAPEPPKNLANRSLPVGAVRRTSWVRLHDRTFPNPPYWNQAGKYRFDSPAAEFGVFYSGQDLTTAFLEVFGDKVRHSRRLALSQIERYDIYSVEVPAQLKVLTLEGSNLAKIGATLGCFAGSYPLSQRWGAALMAHPANVDGLVYLGRRSGAHCLALFGNEAPVKAYQRALSISSTGALADNLEFWQLADTLGLAVF